LGKVARKGKAKRAGEGNASNANYATNREKDKARNAAYHAAHREKNKARMVSWRAANPGYKLRKREEAAGRPRPEICEACKEPPDYRGLVWDHCHESSHFRGWICHPCNLALGHVRDSTYRLLMLVDYLRSNDSNLAVAA
jgi:Recombination endonuclease VII